MQHQIFLQCNNDLFTRSKGIKLRGGQSYHLKITPQVHTTTQSFNELPLEDRGCKLRTEVSDRSLFNSYSEQGCIFECVLKVGTGNSKPNCTPWDYPLPHGMDDAPLCTSYSDGKTFFNSLKGFETMMEDPEILDNCTHECMPNCEEVTYSYMLDTTYLEANELCHEKDTREVRVHLKYY